MHEISMPSLGMAPGDVYLTQWTKQPGDLISQGDIVALVETDKAELEIEALSDGVLGRHLVAADTSVPSGSTIAWILAAGETEPPQPGEPTPAIPAPAVAIARAAERSPATDAPILHSSDRTRDAASGELEPYELSPRARSGAQSVPQSLPAVTPTDLAAEPAPADRFRSAVAHAVSQSWTQIPHFAVWRELRAEKLQGVLASFRAFDGSITFTDVLLKAYALSLIERFDTTRIDLGIAVATDRGVAIPVLAGVATSDLLSIARMRKAAVERARDGRMNATDGTTPHSSVSNLGAYGVDSFTGIVPLGQTSLLTVGAAAKRPVVEGDALGIGTTVQVTLNVDHRVWDGEHAARVLQKLAAIAAEPGALLSLT